MQQMAYNRRLAICAICGHTYRYLHVRGTWILSISVVASHLTF